MKTTLFLGLGVVIAAVAGCKHTNLAPPDLSAELDMAAPLSTDMADNTRIDDLAGLEASICGTNTKAAEQIGVDLVVLLDTSYSMDYGLKWPEVSQALKAFLNDPKLTGLGVGIQYFPIRQQCSIPDYATPAVPVDVLPNAIPALTASINSRRMSGGTPMVPAMTGILQYAHTVNAGNSSRRTVVVLATDGIPDDTCAVNGDAGVPNTIQSVVDQVQAAAMSNPPILTFVIGVGSDLTALDKIALAGGGTPNAFLVDTTANTQQAFLDALDTIRKKSLVCNFEIPEPEPGLHIDFSKVNVQFTTTVTQSFVYVGNKAGCTSQLSATGWYYDDPLNPTQVILCDGACDQVRQSDNGRIDIVFGCATLIP